MTSPFQNSHLTPEEDPTSLFIFAVLFGLTAGTLLIVFATYAFYHPRILGIMTAVAIKQLLIESVRYDPKDEVVSKAWCLGAIVIATSLIVLDAVGSYE